MDTLNTIIIGLATAISTNLLQFVCWRSYRTKADAEAESVQINNKQKYLDLRQDALTGIQEQCDILMKRMMATQGELQTYMMQVAELRATVVAKDKEIEALMKELSIITSDRDYYKQLYFDVKLRPLETIDEH